jgi:RNA polymerase sigma factor (sigma-70 family)
MLHQVSNKVPGAEGELLKLLSPWLRDLVRKRLDPRVRRFEDSEDILQEALLVVAEKASDRLAMEPHEFLQYMRQVVHHKTISANRRHLSCKKRQDALEVDFSAEFSEDHQPFAPNREPFEYAEILEIWEWVVEKQPEPFQTILRMKIEGYTNQEIADFVQSHERTIRKFVDLLRKKLHVEI